MAGKFILNDNNTYNIVDILLKMLFQNIRLNLDGLTCEPFKLDWTNPSTKNMDGILQCNFVAKKKNVAFNQNGRLSQ